MPRLTAGDEMKEANKADIIIEVNEATETTPKEQTSIDKVKGLMAQERQMVTTCLRKSIRRD